MKTRLLSTLLFATLLSAASRAEELTTNTIKFSDPSKPGTLNVRLARGDLHVTGGDVTDVTVKSKSQAIAHAPRKDGLRVLGASSSYALTEKENVVTLDNVSGSWGGSQDDFTVIVPRNTVLALANLWGGDITCADLAGDIDIKSLNGEIHLTQVGGAACVETTNGEIYAEIQTLQAGKTYAFTSMNGEVRVRVPADAKANVRLRTQNGSILTDFDEKVLVTKLETVVRKNPPRAARSLVKKSEGSRSTSSPAPEAETNQETREAMHEAIQAGAEVSRDAMIVARDALRMASEEIRAHNLGRGDAPLAPLPPLPPMTGGKIISGTLNGGGPEIQIATMNGDVTLRKLEEKR